MVENLSYAYHYLTHDIIFNPKSSYIIVRLQNTGIYGVYNPKALDVVPERSEGATKGLRVVNFSIHCVLKSNLSRP